MSFLHPTWAIRSAADRAPRLHAQVADGRLSPLERPAVRWVYLDVLRAVAVLLIMAAHMPLRLPDETVAHPFFKAWHFMGWVGVDLFFVLSGFLIGGLLFTEHARFGRIAYGRFLLRRAWKIWPAYLAFLLAAAVWDMTDGEGSLAQRAANTAGNVWPYLLHIQNYYAPMVERIGHAWSLAVEEHFYLFLPAVLVVIGFARRRHRGNDATPFAGLRWVFALVAVSCLALRLAMWRIQPEFYEFAHHWPTHLRMDSLFAGVMLAYAVQYARPQVEAIRRHRTLILLASVTCFAPFALPVYHYDSMFTSTFGYSLLALGSAGMVLSAWFASEPAINADGHKLSPTAKPGMTATWMARMGACSYSIYLWHMPFTVPILTRLSGPIGNRLHLWGSPWLYPVLLAAYFALSIGAGVIMYHLIERPALALRERYVPSTASLARAAQRAAAADPEPTTDEDAAPLIPARAARAELRAAG